MYQGSNGVIIAYHAAADLLPELVCMMCKDVVLTSLLMGHNPDLVLVFWLSIAKSATRAYHQSCGLAHDLMHVYDQCNQAAPCVRNV